MAVVTLPHTSKANTDPNLFSEVKANDQAIIDQVNGNLDNDNIKASAGIVDSKLASPNNSVYRTLLAVAVPVGDNAGVGAGTYQFNAKWNSTTPHVGPLQSAEGQSFASAVISPLFTPYIYFDDADYTVASKTQKLRVRAQIACNATAPAITFTVGLYPVTVAGGADTLTFTLGTVVAGSTVAFASPSASTIAQSNSGDLTIPSDGAYAFGFVTSGVPAANSASLISAQLQTRNV